MMEQIQLYLILTVLFSLLFLMAAIMFGQYKKSKYAFAKENLHRLKKVPWDTVMKGFIVGTLILVLRKLIYYVPFLGVIQTKFSIWWVEDKVLTFLCCTLFLFLYVYVLIKFIIGDIDTMSEGTKGCLASLMLLLIFPLLSGILPTLVENFDQGLILFIFTPLLFLKMLVSGKYLGIFTCFVVGYFIIDRSGRLKSQITGNKAKLLIVPGLVLLVFLIFNFFHFPGDWQKRLNNQVLSVTGETDMMDLLDAVHSIDQEEARYETLERVVVLILKEKDFRWKKEIYQQVIDAVLNLYGHRRISLLKKIALWIAGTGDIPWAISVAENISFKGIRNNVLKEIREKIEKK